MQQCLIGITKLAYDTEPQNPTAGKMIGVLLAPAAKPLREVLKAEFAVPIEPSPPIDRPWSAEDEKMWEEEKRRETKELREAFRRRLSVSGSVTNQQKDRLYRFQSPSWISRSPLNRMPCL
jgi:hypothetical protein